MKFEIYEYTPGWYISSVERIDGEWYYLWKDLELHQASTGYNSCKHKQRSSAPGYYPSKEIAENYLEAYLAKGIKMNYKIGDKVNVKNKSYNFGIKDGKYSFDVPYMEPVIVVHNNLDVKRNAGRDRSGQYTTVCDILVTDGEGGFWFTQSRFCEPVDKKIEVRFFCNGGDVTDSISDETKRNLGR